MLKMLKVLYRIDRHESQTAPKLWKDGRGVDSKPRPLQPMGEGRDSKYIRVWPVRARTAFPDAIVAQANTRKLTRMHSLSDHV